MFAMLFSFFLLIFSKCPSKIEAHPDQRGLFSEHDGKILLTDSRADLMNIDSFHESGDFAGRTFQRNSKRSVKTDSHDDSSSWHFGYGNINEWGTHFPNCLGNNQSPINLDSKIMTRLNVRTPFAWNGYSTTPENMTIVNNGHSLEVSGSWNGETTPYLSGGVLEGDYVFHQIHFHWGAHNNVGSEHTINNRSLPLEMHMVHYKKEYGSMSEAMKHEDGLAVMGILLEISKRRNRGIAALQKYTGMIKKPGSPVQIHPFPLSTFTLDYLGDYVTYHGSLTTPPCNEIVTWILPTVPRCLSQSQIDNFRSIELAGGDDHNYRPTMPLNGRVVYYISYVA